MGNQCKCECKCRQGAVLTPTQAELKDTPWAKAIGQGSLTGVKMLYHQDNKLLDAQLNAGGQTAIHVATCRAYYDVMEYLLEEGCRKDKKALRTGNTALHEAARAGDRHAVQMLLRYGADPKKRNRRKMTPDKMTEDEEIQELILHAKRLRLEIRASGSVSDLPPELAGQNTLRPDTKQSLLEKRVSHVKIQGLRLDPNKSNAKLAKDIIPSTQDEHDQFLREKEEEIERKRKIADRLAGKVDPNAQPTEFAEKMGCELFEVAAFFTRRPEKDKLWTTFIGKKKKITTSRDLFKLVYGLTQTTLRKTSRGRGQPPKDPVKDVVKRLEKVVSGGKREWELNVDTFEEKFAEWLFEVSDEMVKETEENTAKHEREMMREAAYDMFGQESNTLFGDLSPE